MRALRVVALVLFAVILSSFETIFVSLIHSVIAIIKNILSIVAAVWRPRIVAPAIW
jgi:hypothetical protein